MLATSPAVMSMPTLPSRMISSGAASAGMPSANPMAPMAMIGRAQLRVADQRQPNRNSVQAADTTSNGRTWNGAQSWAMVGGLASW